MPGKRLSISEHAAVVLAVRKTNNVPFARRLSEGYLFFVDTDEEADWLDKLMRRDGLAETSPAPLVPPVELVDDESANVGIQRTELGDIARHVLGEEPL